jgi:hypothetical protein
MIMAEDIRLLEIESPETMVEIEAVPSLPIFAGTSRHFLEPIPPLVSAAGPNARFAWDEFFQGEIANAHTRKIERGSQPDQEKRHANR